ncbi:MAG TPA: hypothetical protein VGO40_01440, partial [Longimicrobium sp.]|jgi:hypothetical protein|nr:hypothetical protein [Longimicrobium sp.]
VAVVPADPGPAAAAATAGAPLALAEAEALAEDVQTDLSAGAWPAAQAKARGLAASQQKLAALGTAPEKLAPIGDALDSLNAAIARQSRPDALTAANRISRGLNVVMAAYPSKVPIAVAEMDVAGRDALYAAEQGRWDAAAAAVTECRHTYAAVQNHVKGRDPGLDRKISGELGQMEQAVALRDGRRLATLSQALLDDVDKVELTY